MVYLLVVEDEDTFREFMTLALNLEGYTVRSVKGGEQAIHVLQEAAPDLVILDLSMPYVSGWDVLHHMRSDPALVRIPVLVLTANADEETRRRGALEQVNRLLVKPVELEEVLNTIQQMLDAT